MKDVAKYLFLRYAEVDVLIIGVGALMNNSIHVQIEIVKFWNLRSKAENKNIPQHTFQNIDNSSFTKKKKMLCCV